MIDHNCNVSMPLNTNVIVAQHVASVMFLVAELTKAYVTRKNIAI